MAKKNVIQKILAHAAGKDEVTTGEYVVVRSPRPVTLGGDTMARGPSQMMQTGAQKVFDPKMIKIVVGHIGAGGNAVLGTLRKQFREWAEKMDIPRENIFDLGEQGSNISLPVSNAGRFRGKSIFQLQTAIRLLWVLLAVLPLPFLMSQAPIS